MQATLMRSLQTRLLRAGEPSVSPPDPAATVAAAGEEHQQHGHLTAGSGRGSGGSLPASSPMPAVDEAGMAAAGAASAGGCAAGQPEPAASSMMTGSTQQCRLLEDTGCSAMQISPAAAAPPWAPAALLPPGAPG